jgi:hypothetical protein
MIICLFMQGMQMSGGETILSELQSKTMRTKILTAILEALGKPHQSMQGTTTAKACTQLLPHQGG